MLAPEAEAISEPEVVDEPAVVGESAVVDATTEEAEYADEEYDEEDFDDEEEYDEDELEELAGAGFADRPRRSGLHRPRLPGRWHAHWKRRRAKAE